MLCRSTCTCLSLSSFVTWSVLLTVAHTLPEHGKVLQPKAGQHALKGVAGIMYQLQEQAVPQQHGWVLRADWEDLQPGDLRQECC